MLVSAFSSLGELPEGGHSGLQGAGMSTSSLPSLASQPSSSLGENQDESIAAQLKRLPPKTDKEKWLDEQVGYGS